MIKKYGLTFAKQPANCWSKSVGSIHRSTSFAANANSKQERIFCLISKDEAGCVAKKKPEGYKPMANMFEVGLPRKG